MAALVDFTAVDLDMSRHYRPEMNVIGRPVLAGGRGYHLTGHHELTIPLLYYAAAGAPRSMTGRAILTRRSRSRSARARPRVRRIPAAAHRYGPAPRSEPPATASAPHPPTSRSPRGSPPIAGARLRAHWGIAVWDLAEGRWVLRHEADRYFVPASNLKLVVSATGLERLGPDYTWRTSVYGTAPVGRGGVLDGDLVLYGRGDPNLSGRFAPSVTAIFEALADSLAARGLRRVTGALLADESLWDADYVRGDWASYDLLWWYAAPVGALGFNDNSIDVHIHPAARAGDPPLVTGSRRPRSTRSRTGP